MESDVEKKDSKTVVIPKEVKSPEPSQNKIEQEHTVALVVTLTDQTMAESIGEENKESTKQVEKKEEPKIQDNEILYENNGREECIIDTRIQHFPPHDNAPTKSTSTPSLVVSSHFVAMTWISPIARRLDIGLDIATSTGHSLTGQEVVWFDLDSANSRSKRRMSNIEDWQKGFSAEQRKENGMVVKLWEEGFSDVIEQTAKLAC
ncbi:hypothetical protein BLNAU_9302 [Blattamonas nauphoetae]|uniref:Uncharacterized protein n=1 Tax=Blattamonas nauphoetae TaxID=2049346 RepID=A0ABQ9XWB7_9EUKA|nr:hypothetical protein BLNAU_9302 [Blattamonas nauphoetae]